MRKYLAICWACILLLLFAGCGSTHKGETVFPTEGITSVTFFPPAARGGLAVPQEELREIVAWLGTFAVGEKADEILKPGSNSITVRIEYADGGVVESGLSTTVIRNTTYYMEFADAPACYTDLING